MILPVTNSIVKPPVGSIVTPDYIGYDNLALLLMLNEGGGDKVFDLSGNGNTASRNGPIWQPGDTGPSLYFDGSDYITCAKAVNYRGSPNTVTIMAWINATDLQNRMTIVGCENEAGVIQFEVNTVVDLGGGLNAISAGVYVAQALQNWDGEIGWCLVGYTRSGTGAGTHGLWINAESQTLDTDAANNFSQGSNPTVVGRRAAASQGYQGGLGWVAIWNRALSPDEILELYWNPFRGIGERRGRAELIGYVAAAADIAVLRRRIEAA